MNAEDFGQLLKDHPEMLNDAKKFAAILRDVYPGEKGNVNLMVTAYEAGVLSMLRGNQTDSLQIARIMALLMDDHCIAEGKARWAAELWSGAYCFMVTGKLPKETPASTPQAQPAAQSVQQTPTQSYRTGDPVEPFQRTEGWTSSIGKVRFAKEKLSETGAIPQQKKSYTAKKQSGVGVKPKPPKDERAQRERIRKRREELKQYAGRIVCSSSHILALRSNRRVIACGDNTFGQCHIGPWSRVTAIACYYGKSVGLRTNRTVLSTDTYTDFLYQYQWENIVQISAGLNVMGLRADGTVRCSSCHGGECSDFCTQRKWASKRWRNVTAIANAGNTNYGLLTDGTVVACGTNEYGKCDVGYWRDVVSIATGDETVYGLRRDGRVYARGDNAYGQCNVRSWRDIIDIVPGDGTVFGLRADGSVAFTGNFGVVFEAVRTWTDIVAVACGLGIAAGLKADGTVVVCDILYNYDTSGWRDIVAIACGNGYVVGLQTDGTVVFTGKARNGEDKIAGQNLFH